MNTLEGELTALLNRYSEENASDTPDWILASYMMGSLRVFNDAVHKRERWYGLGRTVDSGQEYPL